MSAERLYLQMLWQEAAEVELRGLCDTRDAIRDLVEASAGTSEFEYPRLRALNAEIAQVERSIAERSRKIEGLRSAERNPQPSSRLSLLLTRQEEASDERAGLLEARDAIIRASVDAGQSDLNDEQDRRFRELTREIAVVDDEIAVRDKEIEDLAALNAVNV